MSLETNHFYDFKNFRLDPAERILMRDGKPLPLTPKAFHLLKILVENHGHIVDKDKLITEIWADSFVEEGNLAVNANMLRKALADDANDPTFIETVPRRGYRFVAEVKENFEDGATNIEQNGMNETAPRRPASNRRYLLWALSMLVIGSLGFGMWFATSRFLHAELSAPILSAPFTSTKFSTSGTVTNAVISPDGKYAAFTDESGGKQSLWLRQIESGENIQIIPPSDDYYFGLAFSNSGKSIYFARRLKAAHGPPTLYRVTAFGGIPVKILEGALNWISVSPDDTRISFVRCNYKPDDFCSLFVADVDGKDERKLLSRPFEVESNQFSPDGKAIVVASGRTLGSEPEHRLELVDVASGKETQISSQKFFDIKSLRWLPSGDGLLFTVRDYEDGPISVFKMSTSNGRAERLTKDAASYENISLDRKGERMIATQAKNDFQLYISTGSDVKALTSASKITTTPDGKLVYSTFDGDIWTINSDGGERRQLTTGPWGDIYPQVPPDGRYIFFRSNRSGANHIWRMGSDGSDIVQITLKDGGHPCGFTPDGKWLYYISARELRKVATGGGEETSVSDKKLLRPVCSPDGNFVAYFFLDKEFKIGVMRTADGTIAKILNYGDGKSMPLRLAWSYDSRTLNFVTESDGKNTLWQQSLDDEKPRIIADLGTEEIRDLAMLPDGEGYAFIRGKWINDAVLLTGFK